MIMECVAQWEKKEKKTHISTAYLQALTALQRLDFFLDFNTDSISRHVIEGLAALTTLTRLRLKGTGIGTEGVTAVAAAAQERKFSKLLHLKLEAVGVNASAVQVSLLCNSCMIQYTPRYCCLAASMLESISL
jgi:Ran GTPase-activating protein (RanGAP) involved in mRNA processing and transport